MKPKIYTSQDHHIRNDQIDANALYVLKRLHEAGYTSYLVGGGVRDLLLHKKPKDFDISTEAEPEEIKKVFKRQCILIGRRFPLAHVRFGSEIIEVATFRAGDSVTDQLILKDNVWGTPEEDVERRDFTLNGLFYDPLDHRIIDYVGGFEDLQKHTLRSIGDPLLRFKQDPVRMIRMLKFRARFGFDVDEEAMQAMESLKGEIVKSSPARVLEEIFRMLESGFSEPFFQLLYNHAFFDILFPEFAKACAESAKESFFAYLHVADAMNKKGVLSREVLTAALIFPFLEKKVHEEYIQKGRTPHLGEINDVCHELIDTYLSKAFTHFPKKLRHGGLFIMESQFRMTPLQKRKHPSKKIIYHPEFIDALTFLKLRALLHPQLHRAFEYWKRLWKEQENARHGS